MLRADEPTLEDVVKSLERIHDLMKEIARWTRFQSVSGLREMLVRELSSPQKKMAYELTDGSRSRRDIAAELQISDDTVRTWWDKWHELAIVEQSETRKGRPQRIVSLDELGIEVPKPRPKMPSAPSAPPSLQGPHPPGESVAEQG